MKIYLVFYKEISIFGEGSKLYDSAYAHAADAKNRVSTLERDNCIAWIEEDYLIGLEDE